MKKVLIINEGGSDNLGDQAISKSFESILNKKNIINHTYNFTRVTIVKDPSNKLYINKSLIKRSKIRSLLSSSRVIRQIKWIQTNIVKIIRISKTNYDLAFIGGGQLILSNTIFPVAMFLWIIILRMWGTKVVIIGVGSGSNFSMVDGFLFKIAMKYCDEIFLRDHNSIDFVKEKFGVISDFIPDIAYGLYKNIKYNDFKEKKMLVGIIEYPVFILYADEINNKICTESDYINLWIKDIMSLDINIKEIILASTTSEDLIYSEKLFKDLNRICSNIKITFIDKVLNLEEYNNLLLNVDTVISARMHSLILGQINGCLTIPWTVSKKIESFEHEYMNVATYDLNNEINVKIEKLLTKYAII